MGVVLINHFNTKKGINIFGDKSETAVMKELQKIHDMNTYKQMDVYNMTYQEKKRRLAFASIRQIKEKQGHQGKKGCCW